MSGQERKARYQIYPSAIERFLRVARKDLPKAKAKAMSDQDILTSYLQYSMKSAGMPEVIWRVLCEDHFWVKQGCMTIFPSEAKLLESLAGAHYRMETMEGFSMPFESFILAVPEGFEIEGVPIPSVLVTWMGRADRLVRMERALQQYVKFPSFRYEGDDGHKRDLSIVFCAEGMNYARTRLADVDLPILLRSKTLKGFKRNLAKVLKDEERESMLDTPETEVLFHTLRLIGAIGVYNLATEGKALREGYPTQGGAKIIGKPPAGELHPFSLDNSIPPSAEGPPRELAQAYHRSWFFRQLRAKRYYQGEYEGYLTGSRYSFVNECVVGQRTAAHTLEAEDDAGNL